MTVADATPAVRVRVVLAAARTAGLPFDEAWARAWATVPRGTWDAAAWRAALEAARPAFERAFLGEPPTTEDRYAQALAGGLSR
ncbi:MAG: hypothetical protein WKF96_11955 [Solirubrobacteraceae bacterium]